MDEVEDVIACVDGFCRRPECRVSPQCKPAKQKLYVLVADYGYDGLRFHGVFESHEKAAAAGFEHPTLYGAGRIIETTLNERVNEVPYAKRHPA